MLLSIGHAGGDRRWVELDELIARLTASTT
jgi:hypothetical protein